MATLTIRLPNEKHIRLKELAQTRGISVNKLIEELSTIALAEFDACTRFKAMAVTGNPEAGLRILDKLDNLTEQGDREALLQADRSALNLK
ncbi:MULTISPECIES: toxin-antitoxin system HicB family antitoxin [Nostocales]|jgi:predicted DNA-binding ribbon-helix-helix protein|uniref:Toxin-antitoxin system HicB family antitoxin n=1 Tax=Aphanizomenon flos-aquae FACHB-1040 TaxID=2692887 RepID=A0ABR8C2Z0_APHFL|nr:MULTISPECIES: toxin-antitoxin system HicB family antitoxin [Nostocales]MBO1070128.1 toxin-antitoxin system HicB family antitoxin [Dolichospermum sp. DEX189]MDK2411727.1 toxin-antitoxin system HicB family antitoxin [Aphanizomenon sp. 202]MDK2458657.1 toxin-antitoxin system HicB family antitoxin [Aphanizomenon sp. PH219]QSV69659.1 MAG: toxin-antitoxin system HicB family antitoxin [Aphanizomenon flos-aquae KM1D3_PB]ALB39205.1 CopG family transcriptional regulator [Anabaena sp. WA102]